MPPPPNLRETAAIVPGGSIGRPTKLARQGRVLDDTTMTTDHPQKITFGEMRAW
jgi:hypothetical protein